MRKEFKKPNWYWLHGLHDAQIISATKNSDCLVLKIDCDGALGESNITEIRFFNFKILTNNFDINELNCSWWLSDELCKNESRYLLNLQFDNVNCETKQLAIDFHSAEVIRNN